MYLTQHECHVKYDNSGKSCILANMEQVLDVYKKPYNKEYPLVCMNESPKQLIKETRKAMEMQSGSPKRIDFEYKRCGTCNIFIATEPLAGKRFAE